MARQTIMLADMDDQVDQITIDCHAHVFAGGAALNRSAWTTPKAAAPIEDYRRTLTQFGIDRAVLAASSLHVGDSAYTTSVTRSDPAILTTVIANPDAGRDELRILDRSGVRGIRFQLRNKEIPHLRSAAYQRLLRDVEELGWHVELHDDSVRLQPVIDILEASGVPLVIDHFGRPGPDGAADGGFRAVLAAVVRGNTWVKISAAFRLPDPAQDRALAEALLAVRGPDRLLWGSDWPFIGFESSMTYKHALAHYVRAVPDPHLRAAIDQNARRFYFERKSFDGV